uniref:Transmembrane protein 43 n=1 Tax=Oreochromis niloticus TaxID=8128 RepID=A0A669DUU9_ORENI
MSSAQTFPDQHKRVSAKSNPGFLERLSETTGGAVVGVGLFFLSIYVLFTNEGRALQTATSLDEGLSQVVSLGPYISFDAQNNGRLVHLSAKLHTAEPLYDPNYKVVVHAVKLKRQVEMYQWVEYHESRDYQENGETKTETTYTYNTEWKSELVNSRNFDKEIGHQNPSAMAVESVMVVSPEVRTGPLILSKGLVEQINNFQTLSLGDFPVFNLDPFLSIHDDYFYHTTNPRRPEVGDVRVRFSFAGLSSDNSRHGPAQTEVFAREHQSNSMKTWGLRAAGWALMFLGIQLSMQIIYTLVDWVPVLRELVSIGLKIFALCVSSSLSLIVIGVGWFFYRPLVAVALGALAVLPMFLARSGLPAKKNA